MGNKKTRDNARVILQLGVLTVIFVILIFCRKIRVLHDLFNLLIMPFGVPGHEEDHLVSIYGAKRQLPIVVSQVVFRESASWVTRPLAPATSSRLNGRPPYRAR